jgi:hypothetical protein
MHHTVEQLHTATTDHAATLTFSNRLQGIFAASTDQSWLETVQYKPKLAQLLCEVPHVQEAPSMLRMVRHLL